MTRTRAPNSKAVAFNQKRVERFIGHRAKVFEHVLARNVRVVETLSLISLLRAQRQLTGREKVRIAGAIKQDFSSGSGYQAAHALPCHIDVGGRPLWERAMSDALRAWTMGLFAAVDHLPTNFNIADSAAEGAGMSEAFRDACAAIVGGAPLPGSHHVRVHRASVLAAYEGIWVPGASDAIERAAQAKRARANVPPLHVDETGLIDNLEERGAVSQADLDLEEQAGILDHALAAMREKPPWDHYQRRMTALERSFSPGDETPDWIVHGPLGEVTS